MEDLYSIKVCVCMCVFIVRSRTVACVQICLNMPQSELFTEVERSKIMGLYEVERPFAMRKHI